MSNAIAYWLLLIVALVAANLPFVTERILFVPRSRHGGKALGWRALELVVMYFVVGALARALEAHQGPIYHQAWEFYVVTICLFLVFAYPGFVWRYLWRRGA